jgi:hypothetical protein
MSSTEFSGSSVETATPSSSSVESSITRDAPVEGIYESTAWDTVSESNCVELTTQRNFQSTAWDTSVGQTVESREKESAEQEPLEKNEPQNKDEEAEKTNAAGKNDTQNKETESAEVEAIAKNETQNKDDEATKADAAAKTDTQNWEKEYLKDQADKGDPIGAREHNDLAASISDADLQTLKEMIASHENKMISNKDIGDQVEAFAKKLLSSAEGYSFAGGGYTNQGIDLIFSRSDDCPLVVEVKYNESELRQTKDGMQGSSDWVMSVAKSEEFEGSSAEVLSDANTRLLKAFNGNSLQRDKFVEEIVQKGYEFNVFRVNKELDVSVEDDERRFFH